MIIIKNTYELENNEQIVRIIFGNDDNFEFTYENLHAIHKSNDTAITFIEKNMQFITVFKKRSENIYECCMGIEPIHAKVKPNKNDLMLFIEKIYKYFEDKVLYFPLIYEKSEFYKLFNKDKLFIKYKRLYTSIVELSKYTNIFDDIKNDRYLSKRKINNLEKISYIMNVTQKDVIANIAFIENKSWKSKFGQDMVTHEDKLIYYTELIKSGLAEVTFLFDKKDNTPIAYRIDASVRDKIFQLKTSFNEQYKKYSPGTYLIVYDIIKYYKEKDYKEIDLYGGPNLVKDIVENRRVERYDFCYGDINIVKELKIKRENWDKKNFENFQKSQAIRKIYKEKIKNE